MNGKKIKGIQIIASKVGVLTGYQRDGVYCNKFIEMTIDFTDGTNTIISRQKLEKILDKEAKK